MTDTTQDDLVKRLRALETNNIGWGYARLAADRIEELEANINLKADFIDATINQLADSDQRIEELEGMLPEDNRPCSTDRFLVAVVDEIDDYYDMLEAIKCWIEGAWEDAVKGTTLAAIKETPHD